MFTLPVLILSSDTRDFLQLISVDRPDGEGGEGDEILVEYDVEWLAIVKASHHLLTDSFEQV